MGSSDFRLPDDFPDLSLPGRADKPPAPLRLPLDSSERTWRQGDRVLAPWEPDSLYVGRIEQLEAGRALIQFEDGDAGWVRLEQIRPLTIQRGQKVLSRRKLGLLFSPAEVLEVRGDDVCVRFGDGEEWTRLAALRIPCQARGPGAVPVKAVSHLASRHPPQPGERVWAPWNNTLLFAGTVDENTATEAHIHFDDGDQGQMPDRPKLPMARATSAAGSCRWCCWAWCCSPSAGLLFVEDSADPTRVSG
jgi:hypothetical protein